MTTITWGGGEVADGSSDAKVPAAMLAYGNSIREGLVEHFATKGDRNTAASSLPAGHRAVCWVDGVGLCGYNGSAWVNLSPPVATLGARNYGLGQRVTPGQQWVDGTASVTLPGLFNGQLVDIEMEASIRVDGAVRQTVQLHAAVTGGVLVNQLLAPVMAQQAIGGSNDEYLTHSVRQRFYADTGTMVIKVQLDAGAGSNDLVMQQAQMRVTVWPLDAA